MNIGIDIIGAKSHLFRLEAANKSVIEDHCKYNDKDKTSTAATAALSSARFIIHISISVNRNSVRFSDTHYYKEVSLGEISTCGFWAIESILVILEIYKEHIA